MKFFQTIPYLLPGKSPLFITDRSKSEICANVCTNFTFENDNCVGVAKLGKKGKYEFEVWQVKDDHTLVHASEIASTPTAALRRYFNRRHRNEDDSRWRNFSALGFFALKIPEFQKQMKEEVQKRRRKLVEEMLDVRENEQMVEEMVEEMEVDSAHIEEDITTRDAFPPEKSQKKAQERDERARRRETMRDPVEKQRKERLTLDEYRQQLFQNSAQMELIFDQSLKAKAAHEKENEMTWDTRLLGLVLAAYARNHSSLDSIEAFFPELELPNEMTIKKLTQQFGTGISSDDFEMLYDALAFAKKMFDDGTPDSTKNSVGELILDATALTDLSYAERQAYSASTSIQATEENRAHQIFWRACRPGDTLKGPLNFYLDRELVEMDLKETITKIVRKLKEKGFKTVGLTMDGDPSQKEKLFPYLKTPLEKNIPAMDTLLKSTKEGKSIESYLEIDEEKLWVTIDSHHLLKRVRNNMKNLESVLTDKGTIRWKTIRDAWEVDRVRWTSRIETEHIVSDSEQNGKKKRKKRRKGKKGKKGKKDETITEDADDEEPEEWEVDADEVIRSFRHGWQLNPQLNLHVIDPTNQEEMDVRLARVIFNGNMIANLKYLKFPSSVLSSKATLTGSEKLQKEILSRDTFELEGMFNVLEMGVAFYELNVKRTPLTSEDMKTIEKIRKFWIWQAEHFEEGKTFPRVLIIDFLVTLNAMQRMHSECGPLVPLVMTQSPLENFFGQVKEGLGSNVHPSWTQYCQRVAALSLSLLMKVNLRVQEKGCSSYDLPELHERQLSDAILSSTPVAESRGKQEMRLDILGSFVQRIRDHARGARKAKSREKLQLVEDGYERCRKADVIDYEVMMYALGNAESKDLKRLMRKRFRVLSQLRNWPGKDEFQEKLDEVNFEIRTFCKYCGNSRTTELMKNISGDKVIDLGLLEKKEGATLEELAEAVSEDMKENGEENEDDKEDESGDDEAVDQDNDDDDREEAAGEDEEDESEEENEQNCDETRKRSRPADSGCLSTILPLPKRNLDLHKFRDRGGLIIPTQIDFEFYTRMELGLKAKESEFQSVSQAQEYLEQARRDLIKKMIPKTIEAIKEEVKNAGKRFLKREEKFLRQHLTRLSKHLFNCTIKYKIRGTFASKNQIEKERKFDMARYPTKKPDECRTFLHAANALYNLRKYLSKQSFAFIRHLVNQLEDVNVDSNPKSTSKKEMNNCLCHAVDKEEKEDEIEE